jgi:hypothetical protein
VGGTKLYTDLINVRQDTNFNHFMLGNGNKGALCRALEVVTVRVVCKQLKESQNSMAKRRQKIESAIILKWAQVDDARNHSSSTELTVG